MESLAAKIVAEMEVRYAKDGLQISDVIELSDEGFWDDRAD